MPSLIIENSGKRYGGRITSRVLIGRLPSNGIVLTDSSVSRLHAWIDIDEKGHFFIGDSGSISGTQVNGRNIEKRRLLEDLDDIRIGEEHIQFSMDENLPVGVVSRPLNGKPPSNNVAQSGILFDCVCGAPIWFKAAAIGQGHHCTQCGRHLIIPDIPGSRAMLVKPLEFVEPGVTPTAQPAGQSSARVMPPTLRGGVTGVANDIQFATQVSPGNAESMSVAVEEASPQDAFESIMESPTDEIVELPPEFPSEEITQELPEIVEPPDDSGEMHESLFANHPPIKVKPDPVASAQKVTAEIATAMGGTSNKKGTSTEQSCSICHNGLEQNEAVTACPSCGLTFHQDCWNENHGCSAYGCNQVGILSPAHATEIGETDSVADETSDADHDMPELEPETFPWEFVFVGFSVAGTLLGALSYGVPAMIACLGSLIYLIFFQSSKRRRIFAIVAVLACMLGAAAGVYLSYQWWNGWPPVAPFPVKGVKR